MKTTFEPYCLLGDDEVELNQREAKKIFKAIFNMAVANYSTINLSLLNSVTRGAGIPFDVVAKLYQLEILKAIADKRIIKIPSIDLDQDLYQVINAQTVTSNKEQI